MRALFLCALCVAGCERLVGGELPNTISDTTTDGGSDGSTPNFNPAAHLPFPQIPAAGGSVMSAIKLVTIVTQDSADATSLFNYSDVLTTDGWLQPLVTDYGAAKPSASVHVVGPTTATAYHTPATIGSYIDSAIANNATAAPNGNTVYLIYYPVGLGITPPCTGVNYYRGVYGTNGDAYIQMDRCTAGPIDFASHGIYEQVTGAAFSYPATTAPWTGSAWASEAGNSGNITQNCVGDTTSQNLPFIRIWSNTAAAAGGDPCFPASPLYFSVTAASEWTDAHPGDTITVPIVGWSTAPRADWAINIGPRHGGGSFTYAIVPTASGAIKTIGTATYPAMNNSITAGVAITIPNSAAIDSWEVRFVTSLDESGVNNLFPVGVHVVAP